MIDLIVDVLGWILLFPIRLWQKNGGDWDEAVVYIFMQIGWWMLIISFVLRAVYWYNFGIWI